jgi:coat protein Gp5
MSNSFKNTTLVTKFGIKALLNSLQLAAKVDRQVDTSKVFSGKVASTIYVRRPVYFAATDGAVITAGDVSDIEEGTVPVTLNIRKKVVFHTSSEELELNIIDAYNEYIQPACEELAQKIESSLAGLYAYVFNHEGTPGTGPSTLTHVAECRAALNKIGVPDNGKRSAFWTPDDALTLANGLGSVYVQDIAKKAIEEAKFGRYAGFDCFENQSLKTHTVGAYSGTPLVNAAAQNVTYAASKDTWTQSLITDGWGNSITGVLKAGDVFTLASVYSVNRRTRESTGALAKFVVTADADSDGSGNSTLTISPPIITTGAYQTCSAAPADNAAITIKTGTASTGYQQNIAFHKNAFTLAMGQLHVPSGEGCAASRINHKGMSLRYIRQYSSTLDAVINRFDVFYGVKVQNPEFAVRRTG